MKLRRLLRGLLRGVLALLAITVLGVAGGLFWIYATESGARFVLARAAAASGGVLAIGQVDGKLSSGLALRDIRYRDAAQEITLDELNLQIDFMRLPARRLMIENLTASVIRYRPLNVAAGAAAEAADDAGTLPAVELPLTVQFSRVSIAGLMIEQPDEEPLQFEQIVLSGVAAGTAAQIQRFEFRVRGTFISMQGRVAWDNSFSVDGIVSWSGAVNESPLLGSAQIEGRWPTFVFQQKTIEPIAQTAIGSVTLGPEPAFDVAIEQPDLGGATLVGSYEPATATLRARVEAAGLAPGTFIPGWPGRVNLNGAFAFTAGSPWRFTAEDLELEALLDDEILRAELDGTVEGPDSIGLERLLISLGANRVELSGTIGTTLDLELAAELDDLAAVGRFAARDEIRQLAPVTLPAELLTGRAALDLAINGERQAPLVTGAISLLESQFAGLPLSVDLAFASPTSGTGSIELRRFAAALGGSRVTGSGSVGSEILAADGGVRANAALDLELALAVDDLSELAALPVPGADLSALAGSGTARLRIVGSVARPDLDADVTLADLRYQEFELLSARLAGQFGGYAGAATRVTLSAAAPDWVVAMDAAGVVRQDRWEGNVSALTVDEPWLGRWQLAAPVPVVLAPTRIEIANACLVHATSDVCLDWQTGGSTERIHIVAEGFDLAVLTPLLPPTVSLSGLITLDAALDSPRGVPSGTLTATGAGIGIMLAMSDTDQVDTVLETIALDAVLDNYALEMRADVQNRAGGVADVMFATADLRDRNAAISGQLDMFWPDLSSLSILSPDVGEVGGTLAVELDVAGTVANPEPSGSATVTDGHLSVPQWGVLIERIEAEAVSDAGSLLEYTGNGFIDNSEIRLSGSTEIDPESGWPTRLRLVGNYVPIAQRPDATVYASPELDVAIDLPRIDVAGRVVIPEAHIAVENLPAQAVRVSPDSIIHGRPEAEAVRPLEVSADVTIELGDSVRYRGLNLDTALSGTLRLLYESGLSPTASGGLRLDGSYDAYGQELELERGELLFAGPLDDPALDVLAIREIGATRVGIRLSGTLRAPETSMFSDPPMSEPNALSYLRFGRPLTSTDGSETLTLEATALALGLQQALPAVQRVGDALRLDELSIEPTEVDAGSLMAGKYLSPKLYLSYTYGLFNRLGGFLLRYEINDRFSLETRSGNEKAMDFLYSVEKD